MTRPDIAAALERWRTDGPHYLNPDGGLSIAQIGAAVAAGNELARLLRAANQPAEPFEKIEELPAPATGEDEALLMRMHQLDLNLNCSSHLAVHAMLDVLREAAARLRALLADVARERDWRVQAEAERDRVLLRDDDALAEARAALTMEKVRTDDLAAWVDHYRTKEAAALARAEAAEAVVCGLADEANDIPSAVYEKWARNWARNFLRCRAAGGE